MMKNRNKPQKEEVKNIPDSSVKEEKNYSKINIADFLDAPAPEKPETTEWTEYIVTARGGLCLRETPPSDINSTSGSNGGAVISYMGYGDIFVEIKRTNKWSYGNYLGKTGWACNEYLIKK